MEQRSFSNKLISIKIRQIYLSFVLLFISNLSLSQKIDSIKPLNSLTIKDSIFDSPFRISYGVTGSAIALKKKEKYSVFSLLGYEYHYGISNRFSFGINTSYILLPFSVSGKYCLSTKNDKIHLSVQSTYISTTYLPSSFGFYPNTSINTVTTTFGSRKNNLSLSYGVSLFFNNKLQNKMAMYSLAYQFKMGKKISFVSEFILGTSHRDMIDSNYDYKRVTVWSKFGYPLKSEHYDPLRTFFTTAIYTTIGFRYQKTEKKAFKISVGGYKYQEITHYNSDNSIYKGKYSSHFLNIPVVLLSWYRKF